MLSSPWGAWAPVTECAVGPPLLAASLSLLQWCPSSAAVARGSSGRRHQDSPLQQEWRRPAAPPGLAPASRGSGGAAAWASGLSWGGGSLLGARTEWGAFWQAPVNLEDMAVYLSGEEPGCLDPAERDVPLENEGNLQGTVSSRGLAKNRNSQAPVPGLGSAGPFGLGRSCVTRTACVPAESQLQGLHRYLAMTQADAQHCLAILFLLLLPPTRCSYFTSASLCPPLQGRAASPHRTRHHPVPDPAPAPQLFLCPFVSSCLS